MLQKLFRRHTSDVQIPRNRVASDGMEAISGTEEFHLAVVRHCARADRSGRVFSLIVFDLSKLTEESRDSVVDAAARRARATDHVGWHTPSVQLGVILCGCRGDPARTFASGVREDNAILADALPYRVYTLPGDELPDEIARLSPKSTHHAGNDSGQSAE